MILMASSLLWHQVFFLQPVSAAGISHRATATNSNSSATSLTVNKPTGTIQGDVMIASIATVYGVTDITSTGWTLIKSSVNTNIFADVRVHSFYKVAGASEASNYTFNLTGSAGTRIVGGISSYKGVDNANPIDVTGTTNTGNDTTAEANSVTPSTNDTMLIYTVALRNANIQTFTPPSGMTERFDLSQDDVISEAITLEQAEEQRADTSATGTKTATSTSAGDWATHMFALRRGVPALDQMDYRFSVNADNNHPEYTTSNPSANDDLVEDMVLDNINGVFFTAGYTTTNWVIEKRRIADGSLCTSTNCGTTFGTGGQIIEDVASSNDEKAYGVAVDVGAGYIYVIGMDRVPGATDSQWRIEKRNMLNGNLETSFDGDGIIQSNISAGGNKDDVANTIVLDTVNGYLYVAGSDKASDGQWHVEKRRTSDGALCTAANCGTAFDTDGIYNFDPSGGADNIQAIDIDPTNSYIYLAGFDAGGGTNKVWNVHKLNATTGALCTAANCGTAFDTDGIWTSNPTNNDDQASQFQVDSAGNAIYIGGYDNNNGRQWRIEKITADTGAYVTAFGTNGVVTSNPGAGSDEIKDLDLDGAGGYLYAIGTDANGSNKQWRIEKRQRSNGSLVSSWATSGVATIDPSSNNDDAKKIVVDVDRGLLWAAGADRTLSATNARWNFTELQLDTGTMWLAAENTVGGLSSNVTFRLRMLLRVNTHQMIIGDQNLKLQYATKIGTCDTGFVGESYVDVTTSGTNDIQYYNNPSVNDADAAVSKSGDPADGSNTTVLESIEESNNFSPIVDVPPTQDGLWDFVLQDVGAFGAYCFRVVYSDNSQIASYSQIPEVTFCKDDPKTNAQLRHGTYFCEGQKKSFFWAKD